MKNESVAMQDLTHQSFCRPFTSKLDPSPNGAIMFYKANPSDYKPVLPGIELKTLVFGDKTLFSEVRMKAGSKLPPHSHVHEQTGYLIEGHIRLTIGDEVFTVEPGDSWCIKSNVSHCAEILADSLAIEVFSPVREDYLPGQ